MSDDGPGADAELRALLLVLDPELDIDPDEAEQVVRRWCAELKELKVERRVFAVPRGLIDADVRRHEVD